jgi:catechol 2,3-dioxygenase-like lactoylglutathione lyase family enzyme
VAWRGVAWRGEPIIDHIEITVKDMAAAVRFYDRLLPLLAFDPGSRSEIGATIVAPPREYPQYTPAGYYALLFKDVEGIKYEIVCTVQEGER